MTDNELPTAIWSGSFTIMGVEVKCHTLSDGQRIIEAESVAELFSTTGNADDEDDLVAFARWRHGTESPS